MFGGASSYVRGRGPPMFGGESSYVRGRPPMFGDQICRGSQSNVSSPHLHPPHGILHTCLQELYLPSSVGPAEVLYLTIPFDKRTFVVFVAVPMPIYIF